MQNIGSERLEESLAYWKDLHWSTAAMARATLSPFGQSDIELLRGKLPPTVFTYKRLEELVFDQSVCSLGFEEWLMKPAMAPKWPKYDIWAHFPIEFFEWNRKSRRVFHLPRSLSRIFGQATFPNITWADVELPYDSFMITLEEPLLVEDEPGVWCSYDAILVTKIPGLRDRITIRMFHAPHAHGTDARYSERVKERFEHLLKRGDEKKLTRLIEHEWSAFEGRIKSSPGWRHMILHDVDFQSSSAKIELDVEHFAAAMREESINSTKSLEGGVDGNLWRIEPMSIAAKIVVGWCMYMDGLVPTDTQWVEETRMRHVPGKKGVSGIITQIDHICTVIGKARLDAATFTGGEQERAHASGYFVRPHWRRRHKVRPRGSPPGTPRTIKIPTRLIRKDLVPFFGIIGGTHTTVVDDDW